ncbi:sulfotransferase family protein [Halovulum marinum]|uniref:sulfotransferase family protein n=1 Tax=Halovulum marinum TaxID=2662447 RepID=UPI001F464AF2|nr:sulfotransferase [Halovulum marinum]
MAGRQEPCDLTGRTFLLGVGAQKTGTSWLYRYLAEHPEAFMPMIKELHVFDAHFRPDWFGRYDRSFPRRLVQALDRQRARGQAQLTGRALQLLDRALIGEDIRRYPDLFRALPGPARLTGDITPSYAVLDAGHFRQIRQLLTDAGLKPRVVFLMRDPVERVWSATRMWGRKHGIDDAEQLRAAALAQLDRPEELARSRYDHTVAALEAAFPAEELFFGFYETLFCDPSVRALCAHLGIRYLPGDYGRTINASPRPAELLPAQAQLIRRALAPVYEFCETRFGHDLPATWRTRSARAA